MNTKKKRYSVLSYIIGDYELVHEIGEKDPEAEYILVTDNPKLKSETWCVMYDRSLENYPSVWDKCYSIRFGCFKYCATDICLRLDGSFEIKKSLKPLIDTFEEGGYDLGLMPHPVNHNFIDEYATWVKTRRYPRKQAQRCINIMRSKGYDFNYKGLFQSCMAIQRRNAITEEIDNKVRALLKECGQNGISERINQIPLSFILNTEYNYLKVLPIDEQITYSSYLKWCGHGTKDAAVTFYSAPGEEIERWMFNKKVKCLRMETPLQEETVKDYENRLIEIIRKQKQDLCETKKIFKKKNRKYKTIAICSWIVTLMIIIAMMLLR